MGLTNYHKESILKGEIATTIGNDALSIEDKASNIIQCIKYYKAQLNGSDVTEILRTANIDKGIEIINEIIKQEPTFKKELFIPKFNFLVWLSRFDEARKLVEDYETEFGRDMDSAASLLNLIIPNNRNDKQIPELLNYMKNEADK
jgi:hypothetical protein